MIKGNGTKTLETERLVIRKATLDDALSMYNNVGSDTETTKYVMWNAHENLDVTKSILQRWISEYNEYKYNWVVTLKENNEVIGGISCVNTDIDNLSCEVGYAYGSKFWYNGYATEALKEVIKYLFDEGFKTIYARHFANNERSGNVIKKAGMKYVETIKDALPNPFNGQYDDLLVYKITKE